MPGYTVLPCDPCLRPHTVQYLEYFPPPLLLGSWGSLLLPAPPHTDSPVVGLQKCTVTFPISPRLDHRPRPGEHSIHQPTSQPTQGQQPAQGRAASCLVTPLTSEMHWTVQ